MKVIYDINSWDGEALAATIGFFDGVHPGHRYLLQEMRRLADERGLRSAVITFATHPRVVLQADYQPKLLNSFDERIERLSEAGVDYVFILDFTQSMAAIPANRFITDILHEKLHIKTLLIGYDHRFGCSRSEGFEHYAVYGRECGMEIIEASPYSDEGVVVSSSVVRRLIERGEVAEAAGLLGYNYCLKGSVVAGRKVGRTIGFPTANISLDDRSKVLPADGSYAVWIYCDGKRYGGMLCIGTRPTVGGDDSLSIEANIFDFSGDLYGSFITVEFVGYIRENVKFASLDDLRVQMHADRQTAILQLSSFDQ